MFWKCCYGVYSGGNALKYYSSVRLDVRRKESLRDNAGITVKVKVRPIAPSPAQESVAMVAGTGNGGVLTGTGGREDDCCVFTF